MSARIVSLSTLKLRLHVDHMLYRQAWDKFVAERTAWRLEVCQYEKALETMDVEEMPRAVFAVLTKAWSRKERARVAADLAQRRWSKTQREVDGRTLFFIGDGID